MNNKVRSD